MFEISSLIGPFSADFVIAASETAVDATQEMVALAACNLLGSLVQAMPVCGAFTRSAVSHASGVRTPMVGLYTSSLVLLALALLTPYFYFIPRATLAAVLICAVAFLIDAAIVPQLWRTSSECPWPVPQKNQNPDSGATQPRNQG